MAFDASCDSSGRPPLGAQLQGKVNDYEDEYNSKNRYHYRSQPPESLPFCNRCDRESFQCCVPMTQEVQLRFKELARVNGLNIRYLDSTPVGAPPLVGGLQMVCATCCEPQKNGGVQIGSSAAGPTSNRVCFQQSCTVHLTGYVMPNGQKVVACSRCYANLCSSNAMKGGGRPLKEEDLEQSTWQSFVAAWSRMWKPFAGKGPLPLPPTAVLGIDLARSLATGA